MNENVRGTVLMGTGVGLWILGTGGDQVGAVHWPLILAGAVPFGLGVWRWRRGERRA